MNRRRPPPAQLFDDPAQPRRAREDGRLWSIISALRLCGHAVYRVGLLHKVDGKMLNTREIIRLAELRGVAGKTRESRR
jgi:hypothetical protein